MRCLASMAPRAERSYDAPVMTIGLFPFLSRAARVRAPLYGTLSWRRAVLSAIFLAALLAVPAAYARGLEKFPSAPLTIESGGHSHKFTVELAQTPRQRAQGLMFRRRLGPDRGMLFLYNRDQVISMWMKNTVIPLDMLFMDGAGRVVSLHERAVPGSLQTISSEGKARAVLELAGGTVARLGLRVGDRVRAPGLGPAP